MNAKPKVLQINPRDIQPHAPPGPPEYEVVETWPPTPPEHASETKKGLGAWLRALFRAK